MIPRMNLRPPSCRPGAAFASRSTPHRRRPALRTPRSALGSRGVARRGRGEETLPPSTSRTYWRSPPERYRASTASRRVSSCCWRSAWSSSAPDAGRSSPTSDRRRKRVAAKRKLDGSRCCRVRGGVIRDSGNAASTGGGRPRDLLVSRRGDQVLLDAPRRRRPRRAGRSLLTGESDAVSKVPATRPAGTAVISGTAVFEVTSVGRRASQIGCW